MAYNPEGNVTNKAIQVRLERDPALYFDNEEVKGDVTFINSGPSVRTYSGVMIILWARHVHYDGGVAGHAFTVFMLKHPVASKMELEAGESKVVPFEFIIPPNSPPSFTHLRGALQWRVAVVHEVGPRGGVKAVAAKMFRKASLYHSLPAYFPKAQAETTLVASKRRLRAEATLSKDVFTVGEPVGVDITIHEEGATKKPNVTSVKAKIVQHTRAFREKTHFASSQQYKLARVTESVGKWDITHLADGMGTVVTRSLTLEPKLIDSMRAPRCAHQNVSRYDHKTKEGPVNILAPTCKFSGNEAQEVHVSYEVQVEVRVPSGDDLVLSIPFVVQNNPDEALGVAAGTEDEGEVMYKLPVYVNIDDGLPDYDEVNTLSLPSYTTLRRNSVDSVFSAALTPSDSLSPATSPPTMAGRRHSSAAVSVPAALLEATNSTQSDKGDTGLTPKANARRRNSLSVFGRLHKMEKSDEATEALEAPASTTGVFAHAHDDSQTSSEASLGQSSHTHSQRRSVASIFLENPIHATANRAMRRLRANTLAASSPTGMRRGSLRQADTTDAEEDPATVLANFKARYMGETPVTITIARASESN